MTRLRKGARRAEAGLETRAGCGQGAGGPRCGAGGDPPAPPKPGPGSGAGARRGAEPDRARRCAEDPVRDTARRTGCASRWRRLHSRRCHAEEIAAAVCTIGGALEERVSAVLDEDPVLALALDGLGTAAVDVLTTEVCGQVAAEVEARGLRATVPLSPGMMGWSLADGQDQIFSLLNAGGIGVVLTSSRLMVPRKSASMVIGVGRRVISGRRTCDLCDIRDTCRYQTRPDRRTA
jgi:hypothetical protein